MCLFAVITGDVIDSKKFENVAGHLKEKLSNILITGLLTPFTLSRGDEVQAVCDNLTQIPVILRTLRFYCRPYSLRIGIGIATIDDWESTRNSWEMTGPAFHQARVALEAISREKSPRTVLESGDNNFDTVFNTIYLLSDCLMNGWTNEQWLAVQAYEASKTYAKASETLKIAWQNVQKRCQAARWEQVREAENNLSLLINYHFQK